MADEQQLARLLKGMWDPNLPLPDDEALLGYVREAMQLVNRLKAMDIWGSYSPDDDAMMLGAFNGLIKIEKYKALEKAQEKLMTDRKSTEFRRRYLLEQLGTLEPGEPRERLKKLLGLETYEQYQHRCDCLRKLEQVKNQ